MGLEWDAGTVKTQEGEKEGNGERGVAERSIYRAEGTWPLGC